jgi:hypothetical protein
MAGEGVFITAAVVYGLIALVKRAAKATQQQRERMRLPSASRGQGRAPQTMEELLREMRGELDGARRHREIEEATVRPGQGKRLPAAPGGKRPPAAVVKRLPAAEREPWDAGEGSSIEVGEIGARSLPAPIDHDDDAEALVARRIAAAELRNGAIMPEDHRRFDAMIRQAPPAAASKDLARAAALRQAMIWHEVLSPPLSLRDGD